MLVDFIIDMILTINKAEFRVKLWERKIGIIDWEKEKRIGTSPFSEKTAESKQLKPCDDGMRRIKGGGRRIPYRANHN